jgi:hypothetical protein
MQGRRAAAGRPSVVPGYDSRMRFVLAIVIALSLLSSAVASSTARSGLRGLVVRGPISPVCVAEKPCTAPVEHARITFTHRSVSKSVYTGVDGRYRVLLAPGRYAVKIGGTTARFGVKPLTAVVFAGRITVRNFTIDTGIR